MEPVNIRKLPVYCVSHAYVKKVIYDLYAEQAEAFASDVCYFDTYLQPIIEYPELPLTMHDYLKLLSNKD